MFVPLAEEGLVEGDIPEAIAHRYLDPLLATMPKPKVLVLGCTHFPALRRTIAKVAGRDVRAGGQRRHHGGSGGAALGQTRTGGAQGAKPAHKFLATDAPDRFARVGEIFLGRAIDPGEVELVDLQ